MPDLVQVVTTTDSREAADQLARAAVEARAAACAQVDGPISSIYWWEGKVTSEEEWRITFKTTIERYDDLAELLVAQHSYDTPEILATLVDRGHDDYANWVVAETHTAAT